MRYLLDTNFVSELARSPVADEIVRWLAQHRRSDVAISVVTVGEITRGIERLGATRRARRLAVWLDGIAAEFGERVLPFGMPEARIWGELTGRQDLAGRPLPLVDSLIAATALAHGLAVVTRNVGDFERAGVQVVNPWSGQI